MVPHFFLGENPNRKMKDHFALLEDTQLICIVPLLPELVSLLEPDAILTDPPYPGIRIRWTCIAIWRIFREL